jgi:hypothetical protein
MPPYCPLLSHPIPRVASFFPPCAKRRLRLDIAPEPPLPALPPDALPAVPAVVALRVMTRS